MLYRSFFIAISQTTKQKVVSMLTFWTKLFDGPSQGDDKAVLLRFVTNKCSFNLLGEITKMAVLEEWLKSLERKFFVGLLLKANKIAFRDQHHLSERLKSYSQGGCLLRYRNSVEFRESPLKIFTYVGSTQECTM